ncbi:Cytochrome P450 3A4 [Halocaridina rubra]|uniref:Cytochrome P450 3A4 n=1 Tax=Halocaridina rubra TaxID=373956 RepID=A0AAN8WU65_HALRR
MWLMTIALGILLFLCLFFYSRHRLNYWRKRGIPTAPDALPFIGHFHKFFSKDKMIWEYVDEVYKNHGTKGLVGFYSFLQPSLNVMNPELAKAIFIKDFDHFVDRRSFKFNYSDDEIFNHFLTNATGSHWKGVRSVLSPSFTSGKMKGMFPLVEKKADDLVDYIKRHTSADSSIVLRKTFGLYTMEVIASCAFGMEAEVYNNENSAFSTNAEELLKFTFTSMLKIIMFSISPKLSQFLKISFMTPAMQYFVDVIKESVRQRENGLYRGDFLDLMLEAKQDQQNPNSKMPKYRKYHSFFLDG